MTYEFNPQNDSVMVICPYCNHKKFPPKDLGDTEERVMKCEKCNSKFSLHKNIEVTYHTDEII